MLVLITLSLLQATGTNETSDISSSVYSDGLNASGAEKNNFFNVYLNDTESNYMLKKGEKLSEKTNKHDRGPLARMKHHLSTSQNVKHTRAPVIIPNIVDNYEYTPGPLKKDSKKNKKRFSLVGAKSDLTETISPPSPVPRKTLDGTNTNYSSQDQELLVNELLSSNKYKDKSLMFGKLAEISKTIQKAMKILRDNNLDTSVPLNIAKKRLALKLISAQRDDIYYNTPPVVPLMDNKKTLSKQYGDNKKVTARRKQTFDILHIFNNIRNITNRLFEAHKKPLIKETYTKKPKRRNTTLPPAKFPQNQGTSVNNPLPTKGSLRSQKSSLMKSSLAPGDVFYGFVMPDYSFARKTEMQSFYQTMKERDIGYLSVAFEELCDHIAIMEPVYVTEIMGPTYTVIEDLQNAGSLRWMEQPMTAILRDVSMIISGDPVEQLQLRAMVLKTLMKDRRNIIGADVNELLDFADGLISKNDGDHLLAVVQDVKLYPKVRKSGWVLCRDIIQAFEGPFSRHSGTIALQYLVVSANQAFAERFPQYSYLLRVRGRLAGGLKSIKPSSSHQMPQNVAQKPKVQTNSTLTKGRKNKHLSTHTSKDKHLLKNEHSSKEKGQIDSKRITQIEGSSLENHLSTDEGLSRNKSQSNNKYLSKVKHPSKNNVSLNEESPSKENHPLKHKRPSKRKRPYKEKHLSKAQNPIKNKRKSKDKDLSANASQSNYKYPSKEESPSKQNPLKHKRPLKERHSYKHLAKEMDPIKSERTSDNEDTFADESQPSNKYMSKIKHPSKYNASYDEGGPSKENHPIKHKHKRPSKQKHITNKHPSKANDPIKSKRKPKDKELSVDGGQSNYKYFSKEESPSKENSLKHKRPHRHPSKETDPIKRERISNDEDPSANEGQSNNKYPSKIKHPSKDNAFYNKGDPPKENQAIKHKRPSKQKHITNKHPSKAKDPIKRKRKTKDKDLSVDGGQSNYKYISIEESPSKENPLKHKRPLKQERPEKHLSKETDLIERERISKDEDPSSDEGQSNNKYLSKEVSNSKENYSFQQKRLYENKHLFLNENPKENHPTKHKHPYKDNGVSKENLRKINSSKEDILTKDTRHSKEKGSWQEKRPSTHNNNLKQKRFSKSKKILTAPEISSVKHGKQTFIRPNFLLGDN